MIRTFVLFGQISKQTAYAIFTTGSIRPAHL